MFSDAEGWDFTGSRHANQCFGVYSEERGGLCGTKERFKGGSDGTGCRGLGIDPGHGS